LVYFILSFRLNFPLIFKTQQEGLDWANKFKTGEDRSFWSSYQKIFKLFHHNMTFSRTCFLGRFGGDGDGVQARLKLVNEEVINKMTSFHEALTFKLWQNDFHLEVGLIIGTFPSQRHYPCACMTHCPPLRR